MTMHFRALAEQVMSDRLVTADEILSLRRGSWSDGGIDADEADAIFVLNDHLRDTSAEWVDFFVEAISEFLLSASSPRGYFSEAQAEWLITRLDHDGRLDSMAELELLDRLFAKAINVPEGLKSYALKQIEAAVLTGSGPTRDGGSLDAGSISETECSLLRRFIFAAGGDRPAGVSKAEAELLFRIKQATLGHDNAPGWKQLFVQGVGNYLQGFSGAGQMSQARAAELEAFMSNTATNIGGFLGRVAQSAAGDAMPIRDALLYGEAEESDYDDEVAAAEAVTSDENLWLHSHLEADGHLDELEKALLDFLAEE